METGRGGEGGNIKKALQRKGMGKARNQGHMFGESLQKKKKGRDRQPNKLKVSLTSQSFCGFLVPSKGPFAPSSQPQMVLIFFFFF